MNRLIDQQLQSLVALHGFAVIAESLAYLAAQAARKHPEAAKRDHYEKLVVWLTSAQTEAVVNHL
jgi:hypothetical protein